MQNLEREKKQTRFSAYCVGSMTVQSSHECHLVDRPTMVTWRAVGAGIVELVETPPKLDCRPRRMKTLGVADPGDGGPKPFTVVKNLALSERKRGPNLP